MSSIRLQKDINDKRKRSLILLGIITCICLVLCLIGYLSVDRSAPKLDFTFAVASVSYSDEKPLKASDFLNGVTALDSKDGDLTNDIAVVDLEYSEGGKRLTVSYVVRDHDGNVATERRIYNLNGSVASVFIPEGSSEADPSGIVIVSTPAQTEAPSSEMDTTEADTSENVPEEPSSEVAPSEEPSSEIIPSEEPSSDIIPSEEPSSEIVPSEVVPSEEPSSEMPSEVPSETQSTEAETTLGDDPSLPVILLTASEVTVHVGDTFDFTQYVADVYDDHDDYYELYAQLWIENLEKIDTSAPTEFELVYRIKDSDGNASIAKTLKVYVV